MPKFKARQYCIAFNCLNCNRDRTLSFFTLPRDLERRRQWLTLVGRQDLIETVKGPNSGKTVCSAHFDESTFKLVRHLKEDALPSKLLPDPTEGMACVTNKDNDGVATGTQTETLKRKGSLKREEGKKRKEEKADETMKIKEEKADETMEIKKEAEEDIEKTEDTVEIEIELWKDTSLQCGEIINDE